MLCSPLPKSSVASKTHGICYKQGFSSYLQNSLKLLISAFQCSEPNMSNSKGFATTLNSMYGHAVNLKMELPLQNICSTVEVSERSVEKLLAEVSQLKEEIKKKKQQKNSGKLYPALIFVRLPSLISVASAENTQA